jgi:hypothetical protein
MVKVAGVMVWSAAAGNDIAGVMLRPAVFFGVCSILKF